MSTRFPLDASRGVPLGRRTGLAPAAPRAEARAASRRGPARAVAAGTAAATAAQPALPAWLPPPPPQLPTPPPPPPPPPADAIIMPDTDVAELARLALQQLGRPFGPPQAQSVELLRDEMYDTAAALAEVAPDQLAGLAQQCRLPHRLLAAMHRLAAHAPAAVQPTTAAAAAALTATAAGGAGAQQPPPAPSLLLPPPQQLQHESGQAAPAGVLPPAPATAAAAPSVSASHGPHDAAAGPGGAVGYSQGRSSVAGVGTGAAAEAQAALAGREEAVAGDEEEEEEEEGQEEGGSRDSEEGDWDPASAAGGSGSDGSDGSGSEEGGGEGGGSGAAPDGGGYHAGGRPLEEVPIMERRCPPRDRFGHGSGRCVRVSGRGRKEPYGIPEAQTPPALAAELRAFEAFSLHGSFATAQRGEAVRQVTCDGYVQCVRQALGWLHRVEGVPLEQLSLSRLVPSVERSGARTAHGFAVWQERERGMAKRSVARSLAALIQVAKFLYHEQSRVMQGDKPYSDLDVVKTLRAMYGSYERATRVCGHVADEGAKWLEWPEYLGLVRELRRECAGLNHRGKPRSRLDVAMSLQHYLIAAILSCVPDRQRTLRELQVGRTLVRDAATGVWSIRHTHADYKTGGTYGDRPPLVIDAALNYELEQFMHVWRAEMRPQHDFLFSARDGSGPLTTAELSRSFSLNAFRLTGRKLNPHMVRDIVVTYARSGHASEHELEALAAYMGHSLAEQRGTYDRRTKAQKVQPALGLLAKLSGGSGAGGGPSAATAAALGSGNSTGSSGSVGVHGGSAPGLPLLPRQQQQQQQQQQKQQQGRRGGAAGGPQQGAKRAAVAAAAPRHSTADAPRLLAAPEALPGRIAKATALAAAAASSTPPAAVPGARAAPTHAAAPAAAAGAFAAAASKARRARSGGVQPPAVAVASAAAADAAAAGAGGSLGGAENGAAAAPAAAQAGAGGGGGTAAGAAEAEAPPPARKRHARAKGGLPPPPEPPERLGGGRKES